MDIQEALPIVENLILQRENNAVVALDLRDVQALRSVVEYLKHRENNLAEGK